MALIHRTTLTPSKLELLTAWLPKQPWYLGGGATPGLLKAGGFRLDDPEGEVGIEFMIVVDTAPPEPVAYLAPMAYRGAALPDAPAAALVGTAEHGVLGTRWIYDGEHDPVVTARLRALLRGETTAQHQSLSDTPDLTVTVHGTALADGPADVRSLDIRSFDVRLTRVPRPTRPAPPESSAHVVAGWTWPDGTTARAVVATATSPR